MLKKMVWVGMSQSRVRLETEDQLENHGRELNGGGGLWGCREDAENNSFWDSGLHGEQVEGEGKENKNAS